MSRLKRVSLVVLVLIAGVGCDQVTKAVARSVLPGSGGWSLLGDTVRLQLAQNRGAFLSLGATLPLLSADGLPLGVRAGGHALVVAAWRPIHQAPPGSGHSSPLFGPVL